MGLCLILRFHRMLDLDRIRYTPEKSNTLCKRRSCEPLRLNHWFSQNNFASHLQSRSWNEWLLSPRLAFVWPHHTLFSWKCCNTEISKELGFSVWNAMNCDTQVCHGEASSFPFKEQCKIVVDPDPKAGLLTCKSHLSYFKAGDPEKA